MSYKYQVALSFAGEDRAFARAVAEGLQAAGVEVFYDEYFLEKLWGEDLSVKLREVYVAESQYCIMVLSNHYIEKVWPLFEKQQILERMIEQKGKAYVLPVRLDDFSGAVPGLSKTIHFLPANSSQPEQVVEMFLRKIGKAIKPHPYGRKKVPGNSIPVPKPKRSFTDKEKNEFLKASFEEIVKQMERFSAETHRTHPPIEYELDRVTARKTCFTLYEHGKQVMQFKIWLGSGFGQAICFSYGTHINIDVDNSMNEIISLEDDKGDLKFKPTGLLVFGSQRDRLMTATEIAHYLWEAVCKRFG